MTTSPNFHHQLPNKPVVDILFMNGGDGSGKDSIARALVNVMPHLGKPNMLRVGFADPLKIMTHCLKGLPLNASAFELVKNAPLRQFQGETPRSEYIQLAEKVLKPFYGRSVFARASAYALRNLYENALPGNLIVTDLGFPEELIFPFMVSALFDVHVNCHVFNVKRDGANHEKDARREITKRELTAYFIKCHAAIVDGITDFFFDHYVLQHMWHMLGDDDIEQPLISFNRDPVLETLTKNKFDNTKRPLQSDVRTNGVAFKFATVENNSELLHPVKAIIKSIWPRFSDGEIESTMIFSKV